MPESPAASIVATILGFVERLLNNAGLWFWLSIAVLSALVLDSVNFVVLSGLGSNHREAAKVLLLMTLALLLTAANTHGLLARVGRTCLDSLRAKLRSWQGRTALRDQLRNALSSPTREAYALVAAYFVSELPAELRADMFFDEQLVPHRTLRALHERGLLYQSTENFGYVLAQGVGGQIRTLIAKDRVVGGTVHKLRRVLDVYGRAGLELLLPPDITTWEEQKQSLQRLLDIPPKMP